MFVDEVELDVIAGSGGNGCMAFRREKYVEMGGPFGGNGGHGSDIVFVVDEGLNTLLDLRYKKFIRGNNGENGMGKGMHGKNAVDVIVRVPQGTVITDCDTGLVIADLVNKDDRVIVVHGGRGGRGNIALATRSNPAPSISENGEPGEEKRIKIELKLLADVGLVGMPSVGKSTLISRISAARPRIAAYHFTTLKPNLGVVGASHSRSFVVADLPGLIEGASLGEGLGDRFLRHIERTRVLAHVVDMSGFEGRNPYDDFCIINKELENFNSDIMSKPMIVIANKMDMEGALENLEEFKKHVLLPIYPISAMTDSNLDSVINALADMLDTIPKKSLYAPEKFESHVLYKFEEKVPYTITRDGDTWVIRGDEVEKLLKMTRFNSDEAVLRFSNKLKRMGIDDSLREMGASEGDNVRILDFEFDYKE